jgi:hypothetical protein
MVNVVSFPILGAQAQIIVALARDQFISRYLELLLGLVDTGYLLSIDVRS